MRGRPGGPQPVVQIVYQWRNLRLLKALAIRGKSSSLFDDDLPFPHFSGSGGLESARVKDHFPVCSISCCFFFFFFFFICSEFCHTLE